MGLLIWTVTILAKALKDTYLRMGEPWAVYSLIRKFMYNTFLCPDTSNPLREKRLR